MSYLSVLLYDQIDVVLRLGSYTPFGRREKNRIEWNGKKKKKKKKILKIFSYFPCLEV
jgi:hypothetical protein